jgi:hypothetical protein
MLDGYVGFGEGVIHGGNTSWTDYSTETATRLLAYTTEYTFGDACVVFRYRDSANLYWFGLGSFERKVAIGRKIDGVDEEVAGSGSSTEVVLGQTYVLKVEVEGNNIKAYVDGVLVLEVTDDTHPNGAIGLRIWGSHCEFDYLRADSLAPETVTLTITSAVGGSTTPAAGTYQYEVGSIVQVEATPNATHQFTRWLLDGAERTENPTSVTMDTDHTLQPEFAQNVITLYVVAGSGGSVDPSGSQTLVVGQTYHFTASPNTGFNFEYWDLAGANMGNINPIPVTADSSMDGQTLTAHFTQQTVTLYVVAGSGGSVDPSGPQTLVVGQTYQFTATPDVDYLLDYWDLAGENKGATNPLPLIATQSIDQQTLTANFSTAPPPKITVTIAVTGSGVTDLAPGTHEFNVGDTVIINASPVSGGEFIQWTVNGAVYTENPLNLVVTTDLNGKTITAEFTSPGPTLSMLPLVPAFVGAILIRLGSG